MPGGSGPGHRCSSRRPQEGALARQQGGDLGPPGSAQAGPVRSEVVVALQQGGDGVLQGHSHLLGGLAQQRAVRVVLLQVQDVALLALGRAATLLAHVQLGPPLLVRILLLHAMDLLEMRLQRAALSEGLVTQAAFVGPHACEEDRAGRQGPDSSFPDTQKARLPDSGEEEGTEACPSPVPWVT